MSLPAQSDDAPALYHIAPHFEVVDSTNVAIAEYPVDSHHDGDSEDGSDTSKASSGTLSESGDDSCVEFKFDSVSSSSSSTSISLRQSVSPKDTVHSSFEFEPKPEKAAPSEIHEDEDDNPPQSTSSLTPTAQCSPSFSSSMPPPFVLELPYIGYRPGPSTATLRHRVKEAKKAGKSLDELVHELQNEFYPLTPEPSYTPPPVPVYRMTIARVKALYNVKQRNNNALAPCWPRNPPTNGCTQWSWPTSVWSCLTLPLNLCIRKRKHTEREEGEDENVDTLEGEYLKSTRPVLKRRRKDVQ
ncbi:hypothetical protein GYMLUDRAFT_63127 [Collybiopsis luxurians FD-317 M1]|uniref:Uncharacterized protein n=1 Tax=Collybiopsis luxurians FD-317 M1 TaxID=944289 RepID=A0A0D0C9A3_9AGAR|nr:hypothetical protein GYMLUDRAFT_63127 [Collybiopsis luxurians FD-317 M1]